jgi:hypothetical protein
MQNALGARQADVDKFMNDHIHHTHSNTQVGMSGSTTATQRDVDQFTGVVLTVSRQDKASVLQEHIDCLVTRHDFGRDVLAKWALEVTLCGLERGPERTKETEVYPYTTFQFFMNTLKKAMEKVKNLGGWNPTLAQRDETVANYHVQYIIDNSFQPL